MAGAAIVLVELNPVFVDSVQIGMALVAGLGIGRAPGMFLVAIHAGFVLGWGIFLADHLAGVNMATCTGR